MKYRLIVYLNGSDNEKIVSFIANEIIKIKNVKEIKGEYCCERPTWEEDFSILPELEKENE